MFCQQCITGTKDFLPCCEWTLPKWNCGEKNWGFTVANVEDAATCQSMMAGSYNNQLVAIVHSGNSKTRETKSQTHKMVPRF
jgi:hypothetical protein